VAANDQDVVGRDEVDTVNRAPHGKRAHLERLSHLQKVPGINLAGNEETLKGCFWFWGFFWYSAGE
jgi:hypothetical protein